MKNCNCCNGSGRDFHEYPDGRRVDKLCQCCKGSGKEKEKCRQCGGDGYIKKAGDAFNPRVRTLSCPSCGGRGSW